MKGKEIEISASGSSMPRHGRQTTMAPREGGSQGKKAQHDNFHKGKEKKKKGGDAWGSREH